jgi:signal transduction histidine kinase
MGPYLLGLALACGTLAVALTAVPDLPASRVLLHAAAVLLPSAVGLALLYRRRYRRYALAMLLAGGLGVLVTLAESSDSVPYSIGRAAIWMLEPVLVYLILAFPLGRFAGVLERRLFLAAVILVSALYLPTVLIAEYPTPSPWASCGTHCPDNAFAVVDTGGFVHDFVRPLREPLTAVIYLAITVVLIRNARRGSTVTRITLVPMAVVAGFRALAMCVYLPARADGSTSGFADVTGALWAMSAPAVALGCVAGFAGQRMFAAGALQRLAVRLRPPTTASDVGPALAESLEDPEAQVLFWVGEGTGRWVDDNGWPVAPPAANNGRAVTEIRSGGRLLAAVVHDRGLLMDPALVQTAAGYALTAVENGRLVDRLQSSLRELSDSRVRIVSVADRERRKIERDLHDTAQQRLVALRVKLELAAEQIEADAPDGASAIRALEGDVEEAIEEVRRFARGIYPSLLQERGLTEALAAAGRSAPLPTMVDAAGIGRYAPEIESTVYFACTEALQNATKHARNATAVVIRVRTNARVEFEVRDDGDGFDAAKTPYGTGLSSLHDRVAAVGGELMVESLPGRGTRVSGTVPVA